MTKPEQQYQQKISLGQKGNALMALIAICLIVFVGLAFMKAIWYFQYPQEIALSKYYEEVVNWVALPANMSRFITRPWTIITHMFAHDNVWKVFTNMLWLWCFGFILQENNGNKKIIPIFIYGALSGAIAFIAAYHFIPSLIDQLPVANYIGSSAGVVAVAVATTVACPHFRLFSLIKGGIPLWVLTIFYLFSYVASISFRDIGLLLNLFAGAMSGLLFILLVRKGIDGSRWINNFFDWVNNLFNPNKPPKGSNIKEELFYKSTKAPFKKTPHITQQRVDELLDKINQQGYQHLTHEEKEFLKEPAKRNYKGLHGFIIATRNTSYNTTSFS